MSYAVLHMDKYKKDAIRGIQSHNQRERKSNSNPDIDYERSKLNYDLHNEQSVQFMDKIQNRIDEMKFKKAVRKDAVYMCGIIASSDQEFFKNMEDYEVRDFFEESYKFLAKFVGKENIISAAVHLDEKTPHMHFMHVPITKDKKLCAKEIYTRESLQKLQTDYVIHMQLKGHWVRRGVKKGQGSAKKHLDTPEFKQQMEALKLVQAEIADQKAELGQLHSMAKSAANEKDAMTAERDLIKKDLEEYAAIAEKAQISSAYMAELPKPSFTNGRKIYDEANAIISAQQKVLAVQNLVMRENRELKIQNENLVESYQQISSTLKIKEASYSLNTRELRYEIEQLHEANTNLEGANSRLNKELQEKDKFIAQPQIKPLYLAYQEAMKPSPPEPKAEIVGQKSQARSQQKRREGLEL